MGEFQDNHKNEVIPHLVDDTIVSNTDSVNILFPDKLLGARRPRRNAQLFRSSDEPFPYGGGQPVELPLGPT